MDKEDQEQLDAMAKTAANIIVRKHKKLKYMQDFLWKLATDGGTIVSSGECSSIEIAQAQACNRFLEINSLGFVYRPGKD